MNTKHIVGALFVLASAVLYAARHLGAMTLVATKTGDLEEQYRLALQPGGEILGLSVLALVVGLAYIAWGEYERTKGAHS